jgi:gluconolactonase
MELAVYDERVCRLVDPDAPLERLDTGYTFTEGPVYLNGAYYFTDFMVNRIFRWTRGDANGKAALINDDSHYTIGMTYDRVRGRILRCARDLRAITDFEGSPVISQYRGVPINGGNDVIVDSRGRIFFSDPLTRKIEGPQTGHSSVFLYDESAGEPELLESALAFPNGLALSPDETILYIADTASCAVYKMALADKKLVPFATFDETVGPGKPDGLRVDAEGNLYIVGPGGIWLADPAGRILGLIRVPEVAANLCFDERGIFITASKSIYRVDTKIPPAIPV